MYGFRMEVAAITELLTLAELHSLTCQFEQMELGKEVMERLRDLLKTETWQICALVELNMLLVRHKVEEPFQLLEYQI